MNSDEWHSCSGECENSMMTRRKHKSTPVNHKHGFQRHTAIEYSLRCWCNHRIFGNVTPKHVHPLPNKMIIKMLVYVRDTQLGCAVVRHRIPKTCFTIC